MKRIIFILMTLAVLGCPLCANATKQDPTDEINISISTSGRGQHASDDRTLFLINASFNRVSSTVNIETFGCGNSTTYLYNSTGALIAMSIISAEDGIGILSVPEESGIYYIVINSDRCYSQGYFVKE